MSGRARALNIHDSADRYAVQSLSGLPGVGDFLYWWSVEDEKFFHFEHRSFDQDLLHITAGGLEVRAVRHPLGGDPWAVPLDLTEIEKRLSKGDIPTLVAEIRSLRERLGED
jgi:hypothetical protein